MGGWWEMGRWSFVAVMSPAALSYLLTLIPDVGLGAGTLRRALFEFGETAHLPDIERIAMRIIRGTERFVMPWARRVCLQATLESKIRAEAEELGVSATQLKWDFAGPEKSQETAELILDSVQAMALEDKHAEELKEAFNQIDLLKQDKEELVAKVKELTRELDKGGVRKS